jgi:hypothetical protein
VKGVAKIDKFTCLFSSIDFFLFMKWRVEGK